MIGIGTAGLGQLAIPVAAGLIANAIQQSAKTPSEIWFLLPSILVFFVLGFALYALAYAAAGAIVARQEEVQLSTAPLGFPLLAGYLLVYVLIANTHSTLIRVLSFVPPLTPSVMPARIAVGTVARWEVVLAILIMLASIYGMAQLGQPRLQGNPCPQRPPADLARSPAGPSAVARATGVSASSAPRGAPAEAPEQDERG